MQGVIHVTPPPKNKNRAQTKNPPKNKNHLGLSTKRAKNKNQPALMVKL